MIVSLVDERKRTASKFYPHPLPCKMFAISVFYIIMA